MIREGMPCFVMVRYDVAPRRRCKGGRPRLEMQPSMQMMQGDGEREGWRPRTRRMGRSRSKDENDLKKSANDGVFFLRLQFNYEQRMLEEREEKRRRHENKKERGGQRAERMKVKDARRMTRKRPWMPRIGWRNEKKEILMMMSLNDVSCKCFDVACVLGSLAKKV